MEQGKDPVQEAVEEAEDAAEMGMAANALRWLLVRRMKALKSGDNALAQRYQVAIDDYRDRHPECQIGGRPPMVIWS
jgi:hypothetical protein